MGDVSKARTCSREEQAPQATTSRKRQIDSDNNNNKEPQLKRARLTRKNLASFNRLGKKGTSNAPAMASAPDTGESSTPSKNTSTMSSGFAIQTNENGILRRPSAQPPTNLEDIRTRLLQRRETASPPRSAYEDYVDRVQGAFNKATIVVEVGGALLKRHDDKDYRRAFNQAFASFPGDVGFNNGYRPFPVRKHVSGAVPYVYELEPHSLTLPHVAGEWKGPGEDIEQAGMQSAYDGAALVYGRSQALDAMGKPYLAGHAKVTTFTTDGTTLNLFAHHAAPTEDGRLEYHQYPISSTDLTNSDQGFEEGRRQLRNAQDLAKQESYSLRDELKDYWKARGTTQPVSRPTTTIEDDNEVVEHHHYHQPIHRPTSPTKRKASPSQGSSRRSSKHSSSSSSSSSKYWNYWMKDTKTGRFCHSHPDSFIFWLDDEDDDC